MLYLTLFLEFLKIGLFTFGGGYAMIPLIREVVLKHGWLDEAQFLNMIGVAEVTPGPIAVNMATYVGSTQAGFLGSLLCTLGVILPAFLIMLLISILLKKFMKNKYVQSALSGIKFVAIALIAASAITIFADVLFPYTLNNGISFSVNFVAIKMFVLIVAGYFLLKIILKKKPGPISIIIMSAIIGLMVNYL
ncbi:MAG: chromate transporter [Bacilli bacterium]|nr:chromate transporter [Bacilli bacterium]